MTSKNRFYMWVAIILALLILFAFAQSKAALKTWRYNVRLGETADSIRFNWYVNYDSSASTLETATDSISFQRVIDDNNLNEFRCKMYFPTLAGPVSWYDFSNDAGRRTGMTTKYWKVREFFSQTVDTLYQSIWTNYPASPTITTFLAVDSLIDSILVNERDVVSISYSQEYIGDLDYLGFVQAHPSSFSPIVWANTDSVRVFIVYKRNGVPLKGALLAVINDNVATDTSQATVIGPIGKWGWTNDTGYASVTVPVSFIFSDSLESLYDISLQVGGSVVARWNDTYLPDQDTFRVVVQ